MLIVKVATDKSDLPALIKITTSKGTKIYKTK